MADTRGTLRPIGDLDAEADRLARRQAAGAGIREQTVIPVTVDGGIRHVRVVAIETLDDGCLSLLCAPEAAHE